MAFVFRSERQNDLTQTEAGKRAVVVGGTGLYLRALMEGIAPVPGIATFAGGLPIMTGSGAQIGGIGVSGASADEDEQCAQAGIDAVADMLK